MFAKPSQTGNPLFRSRPLPAVQMALVLASKRTLGQILRMNDNQWVWPERRDLYHACLALADPQSTTKHVSEAADTLLNDLELYDDPHQGCDSWLFSDELPITDDLANKLHALAGAETSGDWGHAIMGHTLWPGICADAQKLLGLIGRNGQGAVNSVS